MTVRADQGPKFAQRKVPHTDVMSHVGVPSIGCSTHALPWRCLDSFFARQYTEHGKRSETRTIVDVWRKYVSSEISNLSLIKLLLHRFLAREPTQNETYT